MMSLAPLLCDGLGVEVPFQSVLEDCTEVLIPSNCFHRITMYLESDTSVPLSSELNYQLFSFAHIQVQVLVITP